MNSNEDVLRQRIANLIEESDLTQKDVAVKLKIDNSALSRIINGSRKVSSEELSRLSDIFEVTTDYLLGRNSTPKNATKEETRALEKILHEDAGLTFTDEPITPEDRAAIESMITNYFWSKGRNRIKYMNDNKE
ncbi:helix-turn-helix domain-containing protein [Latilactobacillus sakei]